MSAIQYNQAPRWAPSTSDYTRHRPVFCGKGADGEVCVGMAKHNDGYEVGMVVPAKGCCYVPYYGKAIAKKEYFVLINPSGVNLKWIPCSDGKVPTGALLGGYTQYGKELFVGRVNVENEITVGKVHPTFGVCFIPYQGAELARKDYEVLCVESVIVGM